MRKTIIAGLVTMLFVISPARAEPVAQRAVLFEEDATQPQGRSYEGTVIWHSTTASPGKGAASEAIIEANIEIPGRRMKASWSLRRNTDEHLHASHTIEITVSFSGGGSNKSIDIVPGVLMKEAIELKGVPLKGTAMRVATNSFEIGLSETEVDVKNNLRLLQQLDWIDIPLVYANGHRAILGLQKGLSGEHVFSHAFASWQTSGSGNAAAQ